MQFRPFRCPECDEVARGTIDIVAVVAFIHSEDDDGCFDWAGEAEVNWDTQETIRGSAGRVLLTCSNGHEWLAEEVDRSGATDDWLQRYLATLKSQPITVTAAAMTERA